MFDFMKHNVIQKLTYKVKFISQINGGLLFHVFQKFDNKIFLDSIVNSMERINTKKGTQSPQFSVSVKINFTSFKCYRLIDNSIDFYQQKKKAHNKKEFSHENSKPCQS